MMFDPNAALYLHIPEGFDGDYSNLFVTYDTKNSGDHPFLIIDGDGNITSIGFDDFNYDEVFIAVKSQEHLIAYPKMGNLIEPSQELPNNINSLFESPYYSYYSYSSIVDGDDDQGIWDEDPGNDRPDPGVFCNCEIDDDHDGYCRIPADTEGIDLYTGCWDPDDNDPCVPNANSPICLWSNDNNGGNGGNNNDGENGDSSGQGPTVTSRGGPSCEDPIRMTRDNREEFVKLRFNSMKELRRAERFGQPEIQITAVLFINDAANDEFPPIWRTRSLTKEINDDRDLFKHWFDPIWYNYRDENGGNPLLFQKWDLPCATANDMLWSFHERDQGDDNSKKITFETSTTVTENIELEDEIERNTATTTGVQIEINVSEDSYKLGDDLVYYYDDPNGEGTLYNTGKLSFHVKEEE